jgi:hypothetical protein
MSLYLLRKKEKLYNLVTRLQSCKKISASFMQKVRYVSGNNIDLKTANAYSFDRTRALIKNWQAKLNQLRSVD